MVGDVISIMVGSPNTRINFLPPKSFRWGVQLEQVFWTKIPNSIQNIGKDSRAPELFIYFLSPKYCPHNLIIWSIKRWKSTGKQYKWDGAEGVCIYIDSLTAKTLSTLSSYPLYINQDFVCQRFHANYFYHTCSYACLHNCTHLHKNIAGQTRRLNGLLKQILNSSQTTNVVHYQGATNQDLQP